MAGESTIMKLPANSMPTPPLGSENTVAKTKPQPPAVRPLT